MLIWSDVGIVQITLLGWITPAMTGMALIIAGALTLAKKNGRHPKVTAALS
jgi:uncharacterized membrane-anchored protein